MFGWEFPPFSEGGLGTACYGLTKGLNHHGADITFVIPHGGEDIKSEHVRIIVANNFDTSKFKIKQIDSLVHPYITSGEYAYKRKTIGANKKGDNPYGKNLFQEVERYAYEAALIALEENFDIIHAHDWLTYKAGINAKKVTGKPLVIHVHATEFDRSGDSPNPYVYDIERYGMEQADHIIAVSNYTKNIITSKYGIPADKVSVVHNAVEFTNFNEEKVNINDSDKVVLFLGRITMQKGPDYFVEAARKVLDHMDNVKFIVAGSGDMMGYMIERAAELNMSDKMLFTGFLRGDDVDRAYKMADLYVMPSVSEPFGITPLEALRNNTPVIVSKTSGVSEVLNNCLKVDFWDINEMANKIIAALNYSALHSTLTEEGVREVKKFNWNIPAKKCMDVYSCVLNRWKD